MSKMKKLRINITRIYPKGMRGPSRTMTVDGVSLAEGYRRIKELFS